MIRLESMRRDVVMDESPRKNIKFAAITLSQATTRLNFAVEVSQGMAFHPSMPFEVTDYWKEWIGTLRFGEISQANLVLLATKPTANPTILDNEKQELEGIVLQLLYSLLILGVPEYANMNVLTGADTNETSEVRQISRMPRFYVGSGNSPFPITEEAAIKAGEMFAVIRHINSTKGKFTELRRGLKIFQKALAESQDYDRLHQFVRALDALVITEKGRGARQFRHRCHTFTMQNKETDKILDNLYELRGRVEHLRDWDKLFPGLRKEERLRTTNLRTRQAEALTRHTYQQILTKPSLLKHFETTDQLAALWRLRDDERFHLWSEKIDLTAVSLEPD